MGGVLWSISTISAVTSIFANKAVLANKASIDYCTLPVEGSITNHLLFIAIYYISITMVIMLGCIIAIQIIIVVAIIEYTKYNNKFINENNLIIKDTNFHFAKFKEVLDKLEKLNTDIVTNNNITCEFISKLKVYQKQIDKTTGNIAISLQEIKNENKAKNSLDNSKQMNTKPLTIKRNRKLKKAQNKDNKKIVTMAYPK